MTLLSVTLGWLPHLPRSTLINPSASALRSASPILGREFAPLVTVCVRTILLRAAHLATSAAEGEGAVQRGAGAPPLHVARSRTGNADQDAAPHTTSAAREDFTAVNQGELAHLHFS
ncbi:hypothetical protein FRC10_009060 [Ceratobasidium sp. 414]|nr:hypothetical protein FRC10_009060 [Ceratobasidium sp. 414]